jgi:GTP cyclohydrolase II
MSRLRDRADPGGASPRDPDASLALIARAVDAMRAGTFVRIRDPGGGEIAVVAVETVGRSVLSRFESRSHTFLVLTHARARTLKMPLYTQDIVALRLSPPFNAERLRAIADPTADLAEPLKGPFEMAREIPSGSCSAAIRLAKLSGLLPAVVAGPGDIADGGIAIPASAIEEYDDVVASALRLVTKARVPLENAENSELAVFRAGAGEPEHYAIILGNPATDRPVLVRLHSECFTGDLLASLRCDCGAQLRGAIRTIATAEGGVLLYLAQEGRGIGLVNKLRAYRLQDQGFDTMEANERLGFESDERMYGIAARILTLLGYKSIRLLTNNPDKIKALTDRGIDVVERVPHTMPANVHNREYLRAKAQKGGHLFNQ